MKPIIQTILVDSRHTSGMAGVYISRVDLYFAEKDEVGGVHLYMKNVENGIPLRDIIPYSSVIVKSEDITTSTDGSSATTFTFDAPIFLQEGKEYAFVISPENGSPDFKVWTYTIGAKDKATNQVSNQSFNLGNIYLSTDQPSSLPTENEDVKMTIYKASYGLNPTGFVQVHNDDYEFFTLSSTQGIFQTGEPIIKVSTNTANSVTVSSKRLATQLTTLVDGMYSASQGDITNDEFGNSFAVNYRAANNASSDLDEHYLLMQQYYFDRSLFSDLDDTFVQYIREHFIVEDDTNFNKTYAYGTSTLFESEFNVGDQMIVVSNNGVYDVNEVINVVNNTLIEVKDTWNLNESGVYDIYSDIEYIAEPGVIAYVESYNSDTGTLVCNRSNAANTSHAFANTNGIVGITSQANATITMNSTQVSVAQLINNRAEPPLTSINATLTTNAGGGSSRQMNYAFGENKFMNEDVVVKSRSDEIRDDAGAKSFTATFTLAGVNRHVSPQLLQTPITLSTYKNIVQPTTTDETGINGNATSKFVAKVSTLSSDIEAEDLRFFMDAYRPANTYIDVYAKIIGTTDEEEFIDKDWTLLSYTDGTVSERSSSIDRADVREFVLTFPTAPPATVAVGAGTVETGNTSIAIANTSQFSNGDLILINDVSDDDYFVTTVTDNSNSSLIVVANELTYADDTVPKKIRIVSQPKAAFKYSKNEGIVRYYDGNLVPIDGYNKYQFKIVLRSDQHWSAPRVENYRAITTSV